MWPKKEVSSIPNNLGNLELHLLKIPKMNFLAIPMLCNGLRFPILTIFEIVLLS